MTRSPRSLKHRPVTLPLSFRPTWNFYLLTVRSSWKPTFSTPVSRPCYQTPVFLFLESAELLRPKLLRNLAAAFVWPLHSTRELARFPPSFASDLDEATRKQLERGRIVTELMKQESVSAAAGLGRSIGSVRHQHRPLMMTSKLRMLLRLKLLCRIT